MKFEDLIAWQNARRLVSVVYECCRQHEVKADYGIQSQIQRASVSVMTNIAEGFERQGGREKVRFYIIARASNGEVRSLLYVLGDNYPVINTAEAFQLCKRSGGLISGLIQSTKNNHR